ncbi:MAG: CbiX/SirB N-terminal domain-containing protein [Chloroflexi bacterium]|nr:CbiX/SirB N-terminal domain-containing protein [Chloroflexota bacterium]
MAVNLSSDKTVVVLAAHGAPPSDYPPMRVGLLMMLEFAGKRVQSVGVLRAWRDKLANEVRTWHRTADNDAYKVAVDNLAADLSSRLGLPVSVGYNEFCAPTIDDAIDEVIAQGARSVIVLPTMLVRGNSHTESEIHSAVLEACKRHPTISIDYAWPFEQERLVSLFADQVTAHLDRIPS